MLRALSISRVLDCLHVAFVFALDSSERVTRVEPIVNKTVSRSRRSTTYRLYFPNTAHSGEPDSITVGSGSYDSVQVGRSRIELTTSSGVLGVEILRSSRVIANP
jgi:hypothetical protein